MEVKFDAEMIEIGLLKRDESKARTGKMIFSQSQSEGWRVAPVVTALQVRKMATKTSLGLG